MATTAIAPVVQALDTASADLLAAGTVATTPADGWVITPAGRQAPGALLFIFEADASGDTVVIQAGDNPPAVRAGLGTKSIVLAANDIRAVWIEPARYMQNDGTILAVCTDAGTRCYVIAPPPGVAGGSGIAGA